MSICDGGRTVNGELDISRPVDHLLLACATFAMMLRLLVPTEGAMLGDTLWIAQIWLGVGVIAAWTMSCRRRFDLIDLSIALIVIGHAVSAVYVIQAGGHKRDAINMLCEWGSLAVTCVVLRRLASDRRTRHLLLVCLLAITATHAAHGLWQHYVFYPAMGHEYDGLSTELGRMEAGTNPSTAERMRTLRIQDQLREHGIPTDRRSRLLFMQRLRASLEPFGPFALANTFGGFLAVGVCLACAGLTESRHRQSRGPLIVSLSLLALIGFCLVLTKSRTAWVGLLAATTVSVAVRVVRGHLRIHPRVLYGALVIVAVAFGGAALSGGVDAKVLTEATKSLRYRTEYWIGTWRVIHDNPWFGAGPGNFRQSYLRHKLPESSEEISDPHNFVLDAWANGGVIALGGVLLLVFAVVRSVRQGARPATAMIERLPPAQQEKVKPIRNSHVDDAAKKGKSAAVADAITSDCESGSPGFRVVLAGAVLAFAVVFGRDWFVGAMIEPVQWLQVGGFVVVALLVNRFLRIDETHWRSVCLAGLLALTVHLTGAGGFEMPATVMLVTLLIGSTCPIRQCHPALKKNAGGFTTEPDRTSSDPMNRVLAVVATVVAGYGCWKFGTEPVLRRNAEVTAAKYYLARHDLDQAEQHFARAAADDPMSPEPVHQLGNLAFQRWSINPRTAEHFNEAIRLYDAARELDSQSAQRYGHLGACYILRHHHTKDSADVARAVVYLEEAVARYPTNSEFLAELASAEALAGDDRQRATKTARRAMWLDEVNRVAGHVDKLLPNDQRQRLKEIIQGTDSIR